MLAHPTDQPKRVALYARVSTLDKGQDPKTQLRPLREYAQRRGLTVVEEYVDRALGHERGTNAVQPPHGLPWGPGQR